MSCTMSIARAGVARDDSLLSAYALHRPDHRWSLLLVNRDPRHSRTIEVQVPAAAAPNSSARALHGPIDLWQYSGAQYQFLEDGMRATRFATCRRRITSSTAGQRDVAGVFAYRDHRMVTLLFLLLFALAILPGIVGGNRVRLLWLLAVVTTGCSRPVPAPPVNRAIQLVAAVRSDSAAVMQQLLDAGVSPDTLAPDGTRPLTEAARHGRIEAARVLLDAGARLDLADSSGIRPFDYAMEEGHRAIAMLLPARRRRMPVPAPRPWRGLTVSRPAGARGWIGAGP